MPLLWRSSSNSLPLLTEYTNYWFDSPFIFPDSVIISSFLRSIYQKKLSHHHPEQLRSSKHPALFTLMRNCFIVLAAFEICHIGFCGEHLSTPYQQRLKYEPPWWVSPLCFRKSLLYVKSWWIWDLANWMGLTLVNNACFLHNIWMLCISSKFIRWLAASRSISTSICPPFLLLYFHPVSAVLAFHSLAGDLMDIFCMWNCFSEVVHLCWPIPHPACYPCIPPRYDLYQYGRGGRPLCSPALGESDEEQILCGRKKMPHHFS